MIFDGLKVGLAFTGSFCTFENAFIQLEKIIAEGAKVQTIFSNSSQTVDCRFGQGDDFVKRAKELTGLPPMLKIETAEAIGPKGLFDIMVILPCTGNTLAKLANGITDTPVLMAAKAHLRNEKPLILSVSTNDALSMNMKNIGLLLNTKHIFFIPFGQDAPDKKPNSMIAHTDLLIPAIEAAMTGKQLQPIIQSPFKPNNN